MNRIISWTQTIRLRQVLTAFLLGITFLIGAAFSNYLPAANAKPLASDSPSANVEEQMPGSYISRPSIEGRDVKKYNSLQEEEHRFYDLHDSQGASKPSIETVDNDRRTLNNAQQSRDAVSDDAKGAASGVVKGIKNAVEDAAAAVRGR